MMKYVKRLLVDFSESFVYIHCLYVYIEYLYNLYTKTKSSRLTQASLYVFSWEFLF